MPDPYLTFAWYRPSFDDDDAEIAMRFDTEGLRLPVPGDDAYPWVEAAAEGLIEDTSGTIHVISPLALVVPHA